MAYSGSTNFSATSFGAGASNYTGEVLEDLITYAAQENETYKEGLIHIKSGIQKRFTLPGIGLGEIIQDRKATPVSPTDSKGTFQFSERYLEPNDFMIYTEFDPRDMENYYKPFQPVGPLVFRTLDPKVQATMIRLIIEGKDEYINHAIWCSATPTEKANIATTSTAPGATSEIGANDAAGPMKYFNGAIARMLININASATSEDAKSGKVQLAGTGQFANGAAVHAELYAMWSKVPAKLRKKAGLKILMDYSTWDKYDLYMSENHHKYSDDRKENEHLFHGKRIVPLTSLPEDTIIIGNFTTGQDSNLWMGIDYANDENILQVDKLQNNSELYFFKALLKMDVNIVRPSEIVAHLPFTYGGGGTEYTYSAVTGDDLYSVVAEPTGNPSTSGYFEKSGSTYAASEDTSVNSEKTYYTAKSPKTEGWYTKDGDVYTATNDTTQQEGTTYYVRS